MNQDIEIYLKYTFNNNNDIVLSNNYQSINNIKVTKNKKFFFLKKGTNNFSIRPFKNYYLIVYDNENIGYLNNKNGIYFIDNNPGIKESDNLVKLRPVLKEEVQKNNNNVVKDFFNIDTSRIYGYKFVVPSKKVEESQKEEKPVDTRYKVKYVKYNDNLYNLNYIIKQPKLEEKKSLPEKKNVDQKIEKKIKAVKKENKTLDWKVVERPTTKPGKIFETISKPSHILQHPTIIPMNINCEEILQYEKPFMASNYYYNFNSELRVNNYKSYNQKDNRSIVKNNKGLSSKQDNSTSTKDNQYKLNIKEVSDTFHQKL